MKNKYGVSKQLIFTLCIFNFSIICIACIIGIAIYGIALKSKFVTLEQLYHSWPWFHLLDWLWILSVLFIGSALSIFLGVKHASRLIVPLQSLAIATRKISQGELATRVPEPVDTSNEILELINNFNDMAQKFEVSNNNAHIWNAAIAHELRTPITILQGRLQGVVDEVFEPNHSLMKSLLHQVEGLSYLVEDLRTLSLFENQQLKLKIEPVNFEESVNKIKIMFSEKLSNARIEILSEVSDDLIYCDQRRIEQILIALIDNAIRYANTGVIRIRSVVKENMWILEVQDDGPGIPVQYQNELFTPFFRVEQSRNREFGGTGLGLSVVHAIVLAHAGQIQYENKNHNSLFMIRINMQK
ncbi:two-component sensor histidine kinase AdeS [Acinetobacter baumannii]|uniref:histidine kinase n=1 Tax=Acinetobacter baumannii TaxID=470 RepID=A0A3F3MW58_ACIBA|nr:two-component sensor histidine kinase AdeS [Acinetobacter baumannii]PZM18793.1 two-component sensor histidine kinase AdeS [Acinetobacter baumannii]